MSIHLLPSDLRGRMSDNLIFSFERGGGAAGDSFKAGSPVKRSLERAGCVPWRAFGNPKARIRTRWPSFGITFVRVPPSMMPSDGDPPRRKSFHSFDARASCRVLVMAFSLLWCETRVRGSRPCTSIRLHPSLARRPSAGRAGRRPAQGRDCIAAARASVSKNLREDSLADRPRQSPEDDEAFAEPVFRLLNPFKRENLLNDAGLSCNRCPRSPGLIFATLASRKGILASVGRYKPYRSAR